MVALRILVPPVRVRVLPGQLEKAFNESWTFFLYIQHTQPCPSSEEIKFNSMVDAANYMVDKGWNFQQAYSSAYGGKPVIHWIFYKDADNMDKAREGIMTKTEYQKLKK